MEKQKLTKGDKKFFESLPIAEVIRLHDEFGVCFECNDGSVEYSYIENVA